MVTSVNDHNDFRVTGRKLGSLPEYHEVWSNLPEFIRVRSDSKEQLNLRRMP